MITNIYFVKGLLWLLLSLVASNLNDILMKGLGQDLPAIEVVFWRFLFGTISLLPFLGTIKSTQWDNSRFLLHSLRGVLLFIGITLWCYGLKTLPITMATVLSFTIPIFTLPLAYLLLKEQVSLTRWMSTIGGFIGVAFILIPAVLEFSWTVFAFIGASFLFALLDVINKKHVVKEEMVTMLFCSALATTCFSAIPSYFVWKLPDCYQLCLLFTSGVGANLVIFCVLKSFKLMDASLLAPFRYLEFPFSILAGFLFFQEVPSKYTYLGAAIIVPMSIFITFYELKSKRANLTDKGNSCSC